MNMGLEEPLENLLSHNGDCRPCTYQEANMFVKDIDVNVDFFMHRSKNVKHAPVVFTAIASVISYDDVDGGRVEATTRAATNLPKMSALLRGESKLTSS